MFKKLATGIMFFLLFLLFQNISASDFTEVYDDSEEITATPRRDTLSEDYKALVGGIGYVYNENSEIGSFNIEVLHLLAHKKVEYRFGLAPISFVKRGSSVYRYSFQTPVSLLSLGMGVLIHNMIHKGDDYKPLENPDMFTSLLMSPNSSIQFNIRKGFQIGLTTQTDFLLYRVHEGERGILFTPSLTFTAISQNLLVGRAGFTFAVTHTSFLNFDGANKADGFGLRLYFYGDLNSH